MQGGTVEHATIVATVRDLTKGWSYTALSRARGETWLHIDASDSAAALERSELGGADRWEPSGCTQVQERSRFRRGLLRIRVAGVRDRRDARLEGFADA